MIAYNTPDTLTVLAHHMTKFQNLPFSWYWTRNIPSSQALVNGPVAALNFVEGPPRLEGFGDSYDRYLQRATPFLARHYREGTSPYAQVLDADGFRFDPGFTILSPCAVFLPKEKGREIPRRWRLKGDLTWIWFSYEVSELLLPYREMIRDKDWDCLKPILPAILLQAFDYFYVAHQRDWRTEIKAHPKLDFYEWYEKGRTIPKAGLEEIKRGGDVYEVLRYCRHCLKRKSDCVCGAGKAGQKVKFRNTVVEIR